jgi:hypothetical protein
MRAGTLFYSHAIAVVGVGPAGSAREPVFAVVGV